MTYVVIADHGVNIRETIETASAKSKHLNKGDVFEVMDVVEYDGMPRLQLSDGSGWTSVVGKKSNEVLVRPMGNPRPKPKPKPKPERRRIVGSSGSWHLSAAEEAEVRGAAELVSALA